MRGLRQRSAQCEDAGGAIAEAASVGRVLGLGGPGRKAFDRKVKRELDPIFNEVHALFITAREIIPVVALQQRAHGEEIFDRDLALTRIRILQRLFFREEINDGRIELQEFLLNRKAGGHAGDSLAGRARIHEAGGIEITEVVVVGELAVAGDQDAGDFLELAGANGVVDSL